MINIIEAKKGRCVSGNMARKSSLGGSYFLFTFIFKHESTRTILPDFCVDSKNVRNHLKNI